MSSGLNNNTNSIFLTLIFGILYFQKEIKGLRLILLIFNKFLETFIQIIQFVM